jgi:hypothetical protein
MRSINTKRIHTVMWALPTLLGAALVVLAFWSVDRLGVFSVAIGVSGGWSLCHGFHTWLTLA